MFELRDDIESDLTIEEDTRLYGCITGDVKVKPGRLLIVHGVVGGKLLLETGAILHVYGAVTGDVVNHGADLRVWKTGTIRGVLLNRDSATQVESGAKVRALSELPAPDESQPLTGSRVLVVEDDDVTRSELVDLLQAHGADAFAAADGGEAYETFVRERPTAIVVDLWMPNVDGYNFLKRVRSLSFEAGGLTPAIAMTASSADSAEKALFSGFHALLIKPFRPSNLVECLHSFRGETARAEAHSRRWLLAPSGSAALTLTFRDYVRALDVREAVRAVADRVVRAAGAVVVDARDVTGFEASVGSVAEHAIWEHRCRIERVVLVGGDRSVRLVVAAVCRALSVPFVSAEELPRSG